VFPSNADSVFWSTHSAMLHKSKYFCEMHSFSNVT
jgi:hypothetical protein